MIQNCETPKMDAQILKKCINVPARAISYNINRRCAEARREGQAAFLVKSDLKEDQSKPHGIGPVPAGTATLGSK
jgi:hypothetical protein